MINLMYARQADRPLRLRVSSNKRSYKSPSRDRRPMSVAKHSCRLTQYRQVQGFRPRGIVRVPGVLGRSRRGKSRAKCGAGMPSASRRSIRWSAYRCHVALKLQGVCAMVWSQGNIKRENHPSPWICFSSRYSNMLSMRSFISRHRRLATVCSCIPCKLLK